MRGCKGKYKEVLEEGRGPRVARSKGSKVKGSQELRYLKLTFKYELDSKEGPSCLNKFNVTTIYPNITNNSTPSLDSG